MIKEKCICDKSNKRPYQEENELEHELKKSKTSNWFNRIKEYFDF